MTSTQIVLREHKTFPEIKFGGVKKDIKNILFRGFVLKPTEFRRRLPIGGITAERWEQMGQKYRLKYQVEPNVL
jgi:hypothetical protein